MKKRKILSLVLSVCLLIGLLPAQAAAAPGEAASYAVYVHGGTMTRDGTAVRSGASLPAGTVLTVTLEEDSFPDRQFAYWAGSDGTQVPQRSFRLLVDRLTAFYPVFTDLAGSFGEWRELERGALCTDGTLYVREDSAQGLKEYRFERGYHNTYTYERLNNEQHTIHCSACPYTDVNTHGWNSGEVTTEATCAAEGVKTYTCTQCGATKTEAIEKKTSHTYPYYPKDSDYEIITPAVGSASGKRALKCSVCGQPGTERDYIVATLPYESGVQHYKLKCTSAYGINTGMNHARIEEHYFTDNAYYYAVKRDANSRGFMLLWFDEGENSPVYIRSATKSSSGGISATQDYGTSESNYYGILCYVDSRDEFINLISSWSGIYTYDNGLSTSYLYSPVSGYRTFAKLWNENPFQFTLKGENYTQEGWEGKLKLYSRTYGGSPYEYLVDENNVCVMADERTQAVKIAYDTCATFPFSKPDRDTITCFSYYVMDGSYGGVYYDGGHFGMASKDWSDEDRKVTPRAAATGKVFSHWEKYDPRTWQWEYCSAQAIWTPSVTDVTTLRAIYEDVTYHIKVNGGYYQISTGWNEWSKEKYTEGDVKYGTEIRINYDSSDIPAGQEYACITDAAGERLSSFTQKIQADNEYTIQYQTQTEYFEANAENGVVKMDGEAFTGGRFPIGTSVTLTTEGNAGYPYFKGWCRIRYGSSKTYTVLSTNTTYTAKITEDYDSRQITAVWSDTDAPLPEPQEPSWHNVTIANGFARSDNGGIAVSALRAQDGSYILVIRDPSLKREVARWELTDADGDSTVLEQQNYQEYGNYFEISGANGGGKYDGKYDGKGGKDPAPGGSPANILITGVLKQYCIHACTTCGGCTDRVSECGATKCTCETAQPLPTTQPVNLPILINGASGAINAVALEVDGIAANQTNPFVSYALQAAEGYEVDKIYDISLQGADGQKYTLNDNETATITLTIGTANAQLIDEGKLVLIHITDTGRVIYGKGEMSGQKKFDAVDTANGTVTFTTDSCSPFVLARKAGVSVSGKVASYNGNHDFTVTLYKAGSETVVGTPLTVSGSGTVGSTKQEFTIPNVAPGTYDLVVTKDGHLTYTVKGVVVEGTAINLTEHSNAAISTITLLCGDIDGNGFINSTDLGIILKGQNYGKSTATAGDKAADLDGNGFINSTDLGIVLQGQHYGKSAVSVNFGG